MKCEDIQELFGVYWDLHEDDPKRLAADAHMRHCECCSEEYIIWKESTMLIRSVAVEESAGASERTVSSAVMSRIFEEEGWRTPVNERLYHFSAKLRRNLTAAIIVCVTVFMFTFWISLNNEQHHYDTAAAPESSVFGRIGDPVVVASSQAESLNVHAMPTAVASLKGFNKPFMYQVGPIHTFQDYMLFLSLLGLTCTLLIMNWLSRTRY
ncbi:zf-HC2 domain-containing protein [Paenibacillus validus]|uniref:Zf-HC2 domain-containing protein n=1 Tax=Paenibacillus validus TaxID=44253 RepID=A0A7X3CSG1_9BACL|nr:MULTISPECIES: hypothetical protein [Paenibacillus]MED4603280.1 zf-HC2 domain-containing protein [Paenibacillus validus]MED4605503.1 zf-HC2 domain-containing protein [Paenibacillus validus]MUG71740.1 zf-HC2 domain-containing protein [Paenibacillus validus]